MLKSMKTAQEVQPQPKIEELILESKVSAIEITSSRAAVKLGTPHTTRNVPPNYFKMSLAMTLMKMVC